MRSLKTRSWTPYKDVEIEITEQPHVLYVRKAKGIVAFPGGVYQQFKSLDDVVAHVEPFLTRMNATG